MAKIHQIMRRKTVLSPSSAVVRAVDSSSSSSIQEEFLPPATRHKSLKKSAQKITAESSNPKARNNVPPIIFQSSNISDAKSLFNSLVSSQKCVISDTRFYNSVLHSYASVSSSQDLIFFLNHMIKTQSRFSPNRQTYNVLLVQSCGVADETSLVNVHNVLNIMRNSDLPPDNSSADIAVRALCGCDRAEHAVDLVKELSSQNLLPDTYTYNFLVRHLVKNRSMSAVNCFIKHMKDTFGIKPDLVTYSIMIDNVCNSKNLREAMRLLEVLSEEGYKPDSYVYNTIMKGYCMLSQGGEAMSVYKKMQEAGVKADRYTYNSLIYGLSTSGRMKEARTFFQVMTDMGHLPDEVTYTSLMNGMCRAGDALGALSLLEEMKVKGCVPNACTYNTLLYGLCKARILDKGLDLYEVMKKGDIKLESFCYATLLRTLCRTGRVAEAYELFDYAIESKSLSDIAAFSTLESSLKWLRKAREQGLVV